MAVVLEHCLFPLQIVGKVPALVTWLSYTPIAIFFTSYQAVVFFYFLSGFVLAIPFYAIARPTYRAFAIKRILRIYPALWVAIGLAFVGRLLVSGTLSAPSVVWPNGPHAAFSVDQVLQHLVLVGAPRNDAYDGVIWSLVHEMRMSLVLPLIALAISKGWGRQMTLVGLPVAAVGFHFGGEAGTVNLFGTMFYAYFFLWGAFIAFHREAIRAWISQQSAARQIAFATCGVLLYLSHSALPQHLLPQPVFTNVTPWLAGVGAAVFLLLAIGAPNAGRILQVAPLRFLGRISYSLYLVHGVILYALLQRWQTGSVGALTLIVVITPPLSVVIAWLVYELVERPGIDLGHRLASRLAPTPKRQLERPAQPKAA